MDVANARPKHAFNTFFGRLYSAAAGLVQSLDWVLAFWDAEAGQCYNFELQYVVTMIPEPSDYFMLCKDTSVCSSKCRDEMDSTRQSSRWKNPTS